MAVFIHTQKQKKLSMKVALIMGLNHSIYSYMKHKKYLAKGSGWTFDSVIDHNISISKYNPLAGSSYVKLTKELDHARKGLFNIQNIDDNKCFKWCIVRYSNLTNHHQAIIKKADKDFAKKLEGHNFQLKLETLTKFEKKQFH